MTDDNSTLYDAALMQRPGFLIRRLHQIHLALFAEECGAFGVTPVQYSIMTAIDRQPGLDQARLGEQVAIDRATIADVLARLESRRLVSRRRSRTDARVKLVSLTVSGRHLLKRIDPHAARAHRRTVAALPEPHRAIFIQSLTALVEAGHGLEATLARPAPAPVPTRRTRWTRSAASGSV